MKIGILSDTHGLLRPEALTALAGVDHILHAGDVGDPAILARLAAIAPVTAIRGNVDTAGACAQLPATETVVLDGHLFYMLHSRNALDLHPHVAGIAAVISGHSHQPSVEWKQDVLYLNPGSAGPRRFALPITLALLDTATAPLTPKIVELL